MVTAILLLDGDTTLWTVPHSQDPQPCSMGHLLIVTSDGSPETPMQARRGVLCHILEGFVVSEYGS